MPETATKIFGSCHIVLDDPHLVYKIGGYEIRKPEIPVDFTIVMKYGIGPFRTEFGFDQSAVNFGAIVAGDKHKDNVDISMDFRVKPSFIIS